MRIMVHLYFDALQFEQEDYDCEHHGFFKSVQEHGLNLNKHLVVVGYDRSIAAIHGDRYEQYDDITISNNGIIIIMVNKMKHDQMSIL